ncbi:MAG: hypothetical protein JKY15_08990 [Deltaproteobacteria bacterium]|nr:hypothetical protein [Deltaproteobacteria bacterium]
MPKNAFESKIKFNNSSVGIISTDYGITNDFQIGISWGGVASQNLKPDRSISLNVGYYALTTPYSFTMLSMSMPFYMEKDPVRNVSFAAPTVFTIIPSTLGIMAFYNDLVALKWSKNKVEADFAVPFQLYWQPTEQLYLNVSTEIARLNTAGNHSHIAQTTPLNFGALFAATDSIDVMGSFEFSELQDPTKVSLMLGMAFRGGRLNG